MILLSSVRDNDLDRGGNFDALIGDEVAYIDRDWYESSLIPTVRANSLKTVSKNPLHLHHPRNHTKSVFETFQKE